MPDWTMEFKVVPTKETKATARRLHRLADGGLQRTFSKAITAAAANTHRRIRSSARRNLPKSGGLAQEVASGLKIRTVRKLTGRSVGISITAQHKYNLPAMDAGHITHPLFGNRAIWRTTEFPEGWWSNVIEEEEPKVILAINVAAEKIEREF